MIAAEEKGLPNTRPYWATNFSASMALTCCICCLFVQFHLNNLVSEAQAGDSLLFFFSGHGCQVPSDEEEVDGHDECICSSELTEITDDDLRAILINLPEGVKFTMIAGECLVGPGEC
jgi:hypothetical protein